MTKISRKIARKVLETIDAGLVAGVGIPEPGKMCVEAAVCYALGLPHGDNPDDCVARSLRSVKIALNDQSWRDAAARAKGMRRLGIAQLGSQGMDEKEFLHRLSEFTIGVIVPRALRNAIKAGADKSLEAYAVQCEKEKSCAAARAAQAAAYAAAAAARADAYATRHGAYAATPADAAAHAAAAAAGYAAATAADGAAYAATADARAAASSDAAAAAYAAAHAAAYATATAAATAAGAGAYAAAHAAANATAAATAAGAYAATATDAADADAEREVFAEGVVQILVAMKVPGTKWLDLTN